MGVFAEFERAMIRERVNAGIARAKAGGKHCGRPFIDTKLEGRIRDALAAPGRPGLHKIAKQFGVGTRHGPAYRGGRSMGRPASPHVLVRCSTTPGRLLAIRWRLPRCTG